MLIPVEFDLPFTLRMHAEVGSGHNRNEWASLMIDRMELWDNAGRRIEGASLAEVPEASTAALICAGLVSLLLVKSPCRVVRFDDVRPEGQNRAEVIEGPTLS
jgi:hypothetical protein